MIAKKFRFHGHGGMKIVFSRGQLARSRFFTLKWILNTRRRTPRLSVVVSKKVFKSAVKRNRIRRRVYEIVRPMILKTGSPVAVDMVISVYSSEVLAAESRELSKQLLELIEKTGVMDDAVKHKTNNSDTMNIAQRRENFTSKQRPNFTTSTK
jgi:ribonuclease P protein component